jgi:O-antigen/teichoic acid export membrane protein
MGTNRIVRFWKKYQGSVRFAFLLQLSVRVLTSLCSLLWTRLLLGAMGPALNGLFLIFQSFTTLGGLGNLGLGGAVGTETSRHLGQGTPKELAKLLAVARMVFLLVAVVITLGMLGMSPWLPDWLHFAGVPGCGSMTALFVVGALTAGLTILNYYSSSLNYGCGNVSAPIIPMFLLAQAGILGHWLLAREHFALWVQLLPYVLASLVSLIMTMLFVRFSHAELSRLLPLHWDAKLLRLLIGSSFWWYLCNLGTVIYTSTDRLLINGVIGAEQVPVYAYNFKLCELAFFVIFSASSVSLPKITQWLASPDTATKSRLLVEIRRLNQFQIVLAGVASLGYLAFNNFFIKHWLGQQMEAPLMLQLFFATHLMMAASGDTCIQLTMRCGHGGLKVAGCTFALTGFLNFGLSLLVVVFFHWMPGVALATVIAQLVLNFTTCIYVCRHLKLPKKEWILRTIILPLVIISIAAATRLLLASDTIGNTVLIITIYVLLLAVLFKSQGVKKEMLRAEWATIRAMLKT